MENWVKNWTNFCLERQLKWLPEPYSCPWYRGVKYYAEERKSKKTFSRQGRAHGDMVVLAVQGRGI